MTQDQAKEAAIVEEFHMFCRKHDLRVLDIAIMIAQHGSGNQNDSMVRIHGTYSQSLEGIRLAACYDMDLFAMRGEDAKADILEHTESLLNLVERWSRFDGEKRKPLKITYPQ